MSVSVLCLNTFENEVNMLYLLSTLSSLSSAKDRPLLQPTPNQSCDHPTMHGGYINISYNEATTFVRCDFSKTQILFGIKTVYQSKLMHCTLQITGSVVDW